MSTKIARFLLILLLVSMIGMEIMKVYFIMPFPGSQQQESIEMAYLLHNHIQTFRMVGAITVIVLAVLSFSRLIAWWRIAAAGLVILWAAVFYLFNFRFLADKMFYQPQTVVFYDAFRNKVDLSKLVLGVELNGYSKAYPIEIIGYHHQVRDSIGGVPVMITYCTVCRTGRVYSPVFEGKHETFRLVGMDHFNAMFEDASTGSWWRQVSGQAIVGPLKGHMLDEIPSQQMSLRAWLRLHPESLTLQPDSAFLDKYEQLEGFDQGTIDSHLEYRDSLSWKEKSWVVGIEIGGQARAYDWNDLVASRIINDTLNQTALLVYLEADSVSFHVWRRDSLEFMIVGDSLVDRQTTSVWGGSGNCISGELKGSRLARLQAYQEFWHSWRTFHPRTTQYEVHP